jgi:hypothetical protein
MKSPMLQFSLRKVVAVGLQESSARVSAVP